MKIASTFVVIVAAVCGVSAATSPQEPLDQLLDRATAYVCGYVHEFSTVVAEERYSQGRMLGDTSDRVELTSDLLFVKPASVDNWLTFRDVYSVNGRAVRDREERLAKLFIDEQPGAVDRAAEIVKDGYRYNVGLRERTVANPMIALAFLQPEYRARFEFRLAGSDVRNFIGGAQPGFADPCCHS